MLKPAKTLYYLYDLYDDDHENALVFETNKEIKNEIKATPWVKYVGYARYKLDYYKELKPCKSQKE